MNGNGQLIQGWVGCLFCVTEEILWNFEYIIWLMVYKNTSGVRIYYMIQNINMEYLTLREVSKSLD